MTKRCATTIALGIVCLFGADILAAEEFNLSRYKLTLQVASSYSSVPVDPVPFDALCRDDDGCTVSIRLEGPSVMSGASTRLFLSADPRWSANGATHSDGDGNVDYPLDVDLPDNHCFLSDADVFIGDPEIGFALWSQSNNVLLPTCVMVLED